MTERKCETIDAGTYKLKFTSKPFVKEGHEITEKFIQKQVSCIYKSSRGSEYGISVYRRINARQKPFADTWMVVVWHENWRKGWDSCGPTENMDSAKQWLIGRLEISKQFLRKEDVDRIFYPLWDDDNFCDFYSRGETMADFYRNCFGDYDPEEDGDGAVYLGDGCYIYPDGTVR